MKVKIICANFVLMDFINPFGDSTDVIGHINIQRSTYLYFAKHTIVVGASTKVGYSFWQDEFGRNKKTYLDRAFIKPSIKLLINPRSMVQDLD